MRKGPLQNLPAWARFTQRLPHGSPAGEGHNRVHPGSGKRQRLLQPGLAAGDGDAMPRNEQERSLPFFVQCNSSPILQTKELKKEKKKKSPGKGYQVKAPRFTAASGGRGCCCAQHPQRFPSPRCSGGGESTPHSAALDISVIRALNFVLARMSKHCGFQIIFDEVQQSILKSNIYCLLP